MDMSLVRRWGDDDCTIGGLIYGDGLGCYTLELPWRNNQREISCIPAGRYRVIVDFSNRFQRPMPLLLDVPDRDGIRIHAGNTAHNTEGCILVGLTRDTDWVGESRAAFAPLFNFIQGAWRRGLWISITGAW